MENKMEILSSIKIDYSDQLYKMVDLLNRTLKKEGFIFGLALDQEDGNKAIFTIYRA
ncbi:YpmA family protein [Fervidibacillus halotolerans]|uniref:YpmA family protein n=1 Tax=Fervidibacillus halotolerans TaxID=2980027 RepID=A0A9E8M1L9_9BACI|nr:YpmA family protein [Fervidibacillus halotolerans]WAA13737.1 YpmA family protein [Fervidibacillus halotolerans]